MLATLGRPPAGDDFAVEVKYDGQRGLIVVDDDGLAVFTRNGADVTSLGVILSPTRLSLVGAFLAYE
jgi:ATP-dependent DNA ligase